jgi:DNA-binding response OmpR family regulator
MTRERNKDHRMSARTLDRPRTLSNLAGARRSAAEQTSEDNDVLTRDERAARVFVVEDEQDLQDLLRYNLSREGYVVRTASTGEEALQQIRGEPPDLVLLDLMLPGMDGLEVCRLLKSKPQTQAVPVIMLTAKGEESDVVAGLELGADDYITKPFSPRVLMARVKAVLRRGSEDESVRGPDGVIRIRTMTIDPTRHEVRVGAEVIDLTATEFRLLSLIAGKPGRVFTREQIIESIHDGYAAVTDRSVDVQVVALRRKLGPMGKDIQTVRGVGYRFKE